MSRMTKHRPMCRSSSALPTQKELHYGMLHDLSNSIRIFQTKPKLLSFPISRYVFFFELTQEPRSRAKPHRRGNERRALKVRSEFLSILKCSELTLDPLLRFRNSKIRKVN